MCSVCSVCVPVFPAFTAEGEASLMVRCGLQLHAGGQASLWLIQSVKSSVCQKSALDCRKYRAGKCRVAVDGAAGRWRFLESPCADHRLFITHVHTFLTIVVFLQQEHFYLRHPGCFVSTAKEIKACLLNCFKLFQYLHNWKETTGVK